MGWKSFIGNLFSGQQSKAYVLPDAANNRFFQSILQHHQLPTASSFGIENIWNSDPQHGLRHHLLAEITDNQLQPCNILVILNTYNIPDGLEAWRQQCTEQLQQKIDGALQDRRVQMTFSPRIRILVDGVDTPPLNLPQGEFLTIVAPHLLHEEQTEPFIHLEIQFPHDQSIFDLGYFYKEQTTLSIGNHWLDTFSIAELSEPSLYIMRWKDGQCIHEIDEQKYKLVCDQQFGSQKIQVWDLNETLLFNLFLKPPSQEPSKPPPPSKVSYKKVVLQMCGLLLQKIHWPKFIDAYELYINSNASLSFHAKDVAGTFRVEQDQISFHNQKLNFQIGNKLLPLHQQTVLDQNVTIKYHQTHFQFTNLRHIKVRQWPYLAEVKQHGRKFDLHANSSYIIGRKASCAIPLPSSGENQNIKWRPEFQNVDYLPTKTGKLTKSGFSSDTILVASEHVRLDLQQNPTVKNISKNCFAFLERENNFIPLSYKDAAIPLKENDRLYVGNHVFKVQFSHKADRLSQISPTDFVDNAGIFDQPINAANRRKWGKDTGEIFSAFFNEPQNTPPNPRVASKPQPQSSNSPPQTPRIIRQNIQREANPATPENDPNAPTTIDRKT